MSARKNSVLLQTACAQVSSTNESTVKIARLLFDSGSQLSYISPKTQKELKLPSLEKQKVSIKVFGSIESIKDLDVVKFAVKSRDNNMSVYVTALVSDICQPVEEQKIDVAQQKYAHLRGLQLADNNPRNLPLEIDILIGADHYWDFIYNKVVRGENGPVAVSSTLGYILSGSIADTGHTQSTHSNIVSTHRLMVESEVVDTKVGNLKAVLGV